MKSVSEDLADFFHQILCMCYVESRESMESEAQDRGWTLEQLVSMSLAQGIQEYFDVFKKGENN